MSSSYEEQLEKIKRALVSIFNFFSSRVYITTNWRVYYKEKGRNPTYVDPFSNTPAYLIDDYAKKLVDLLTDLALHKDLEFVVAIADVKKINPSEECIKNKRGYDTRQFFEETALYATSENFSKYLMTFTDPLDQVLTYYELEISSQRLNNAYLCEPIYIVNPYRSDTASIFHGHEGTVAYCTTLINFELNAYGAYKSYYNRLLELSKRIRNEMEGLMKSNPQFSCDINYFENKLHNELEEANKVMRQYGIIRVILPLS